MESSSPYCLRHPYFLGFLFSLFVGPGLGAPLGSFFWRNKGDQLIGFLFGIGLFSAIGVYSALMVPIKTSSVLSRLLAHSCCTVAGAALGLCLFIVAYSVFTIISDFAVSGVIGGSIAGVMSVNCMAWLLIFSSRIRGVMVKNSDHREKRNEDAAAL